MIGRFEHASHDRTIGPLTLIAATDIRHGLAMLHKDFRFYTVPLISEFLCHCLLFDWAEPVTGPAPVPTSEAIWQAFLQAITLCDRWAVSMGS